MPDLVLEAEQPRAIVERGLDAMNLLTGVVDGDEVLGAVLGPLDRTTEAARQPRNEEVLGEEVASDAEVAARVRPAHVDAVQRDVQQRREDAPVVVGDQRRAPDGELATTRIPVGDEPARLEWHPGVAACSKLGRDDVRGARERGLHVAEGLAQLRRLVASLVPERRRAGPDRLHRVEDDVELLVHGLDQAGGVLGRVWIVGDDDRDRLPDVADPVRGEDRLEEVLELDPEVETERDRRCRAEVAGGDHEPDARRGRGGIQVDAQQARVRDVGADRRACEAGPEGPRRRRTDRGRAAGGDPRAAECSRLQAWRSPKIRSSKDQKATLASRPGQLR